MGDEELRNRFRRDFTSEPIKPLKTTAPPPVTPSTPEPHSRTESPKLKVEPSAISQESGLDTIHLDEPATAPTRERKVASRSRFNKKLLSIFVFILLLGSVGAAIAYEQSKDKGAIPENIKNQITMPLLYPSKLPAGYAVVKESFNLSGGSIVAYYAQDSAHNRLNFTVQPRPANFDYDKFYNQILTNSTKFTTPLGQAAIGTANGHLLGSLATTRSWALVTGSSSKVGADKIQTAISSLKQID